MGRGRGGRGKNYMGRKNERAEEQDNKRQKVDDRDTYPGSWISDEQKHNPDFEEYYTRNAIVPEGEWEQFLQALRVPLPVTFRINGSGRFADHLRDKLQSDFFSQFGETSKMEVDGEPVQPPKPLAWYPNNYGWVMNFSRNQLRKVPILEQIHEFIKKANDNGSISRQESVSMVPPLFMDVQPGDKVLDMCAAPGSKTFQLLEALHAVPTTPEAAAGVDPVMKLPKGFVVANDSDFKRCSLLTHQTKRVCSPCLMVTNHTAESFPQLRKQGRALRFNRILCDVPCSGDGTMRKSPDIWRRWNVQNGNSLHMLQLRIAMQGVKLLEVGGRLVYSTCTFNPIEDEAVVAEVLMRCGGSVELVDPSGMLPLLKRMEGKHTWHVKDKDGMWLDSYEHAQNVGAKVEPSFFPSPEKAQLPLQRCMRFLPHHQDTGGFFVAVLQKVAELPPNLEAPKSMIKASKKSEKVASMANQGAEPSEAAAAGGDGAEADADAEEGAGAGTADAAPSTTSTAPGAAQAGPAEGGAGAAQAAPAGGGSGAASGGAADAVKAGAQGAVTGEQGAAAAAAAAAPTAGAPTAAAQQGGEAGGAVQQGASGAQQGAAAPAPTAAAAAPTAPTAAAEVKKDEEGGQAAATAGAEAGASAGFGPGVGGGSLRGCVGRARAGAAWGGKHAAIDPIVPVENAEIHKGLCDFYGIAPGSPLFSHLLTRSMERVRPKRLNIVNTSLMDLLKADEREQLKIIATGLKVFDRQDVKDSSHNCSYRVAQEGVSFLLPYITRQRVQLGVDDFLGLLKDRYISIVPPLTTEVHGAQQASAPDQAGNPSSGDQGSNTAEAPPTQGGGKKTRKQVTKDREVLEALHAAWPGCVVAELKYEDAKRLGLAAGNEAEASGALAVNSPLVLSAWKGKATLAIMADKAETAQMIDRVEGARARVTSNGNSS